MKIFRKYHLYFVIYNLLFITIMSCENPTMKKQSDQTIDRVIKSEENRIKTDLLTSEMINKVNEAVANIEPTKVPLILNKEKVSLLKSKISLAKGFEKYSLTVEYGMELLRSGKTDESVEILSNVIKEIEKSNILNKEQNLLLIKKNLAIAYMRKAEQENCIANHNNESCIVPFSKKAQHKVRSGSLETIRVLNELLAVNPNDLESQYLLNIAHMTLGQYPLQVPEKFRLPEQYFSNDVDFPKFKDIGADLGVAENQKAGGTCVDDFNNDGYLDIIASSWGFDDQIKYFENDKNGGFIDKTMSAGLKGVTGGLNIKHADYNNDGYLDFIILRGAWLDSFGKIPNSLMRNNGDGTFTDATMEAGLFSLNPTQSAVWGDFNLDGWIDIFIANESSVANQNNCELFLNINGKFREVSSDVGINKLGFFKGVACGDINNDGYLDIYLSNYSGENTLYKNTTQDGKLSFKDITHTAKVEKPMRSFSTWMFDYNNDGYDDIFVSGYSSGYDKTPATLLVANARYDYKGDRPFLYHNNGNETFTERSLEVGLDEPITTMGCNFGDLDNDGFLDFYLATGDPSFYSIVPNRVYLNQKGEKFVDITYASGFGHIQKGHAIGFGDFDMDGDQDIYAVMGGAFEGDVFGNILYENPIGNKNNWIHIILEGTQSNRSAIGAKIILTFLDNNTKRKVYHLVGIDASFGGNSIMAELGLGSADIIKSIEIHWPNKERTKTLLQDIKANQIIKIREGKDGVEKLDIKTTPFRKNTLEHQHHN